MGLFKKLFSLFANKNENKESQIDKEKKELQAKIEALEKELKDTTNQIEENRLLVKLGSDDLATPFNEAEAIISDNSSDNINSLQIYEDKEKKALEFEITQLEVELQNLSEKKNEYINEINAFNTQYTIELGGFIEELLELKKELLQLQIIQNDNTDEFYKEYEDIKEEYQNFHNDYEETLKVEENKGYISKEELKELKAIFRKAVKICHPDIVDDKYKNIAHEIIQKLNDAYQRKMLDEVVNIYNNLQNDFNMGEVLISNIESMKQKIVHFNKAIEDTKNEIEDIIYSEEYILLSEIENLDLYFDNLKEEFIEEIQNIQDDIILLKISKEDNKDIIFEMEESHYSQQLKSKKNITFDKIRKISTSYIMSIDNPDNLHDKLNQGVIVIEEEVLLYKYIFSYGKMHKAKLYSSFDTVIHQLNNKTINVIDWGCGQALATSLLIDYIKENSLNIDISNVTLIEPSSLALSRGMLHVDVLKEKPIVIDAVNKDIDSLEIADLTIDNQNITLHLFSNILDVEFFRLDREFLEKISSSQKGVNYFICVSPNISDKRNVRLDMFYRYFDENFETELISNRDSDIGNYKRYEKIFKVDII